MSGWKLAMKTGQMSAWALAAVAATLSGCVAPTRTNAPSMRFQAAGDYDKVASCFARKAQDEAPENINTPSVTRLSHPAEIRVTRQVNGVLVWEADFTPASAEHTDVELRIGLHPMWEDVMHNATADDLRACGVNIP